MTKGNGGGLTDNGQGGAIYNSYGIVTITNSTISGNTTRVGGGGIYNVGTATLTNSTLSGNTAFSGGGIYNQSGGTVTSTLINSMVIGNMAQEDGGGIYNYNAAVTITNSTISSNTAHHGGGISNSGTATVTLTNSTLSGNTSTESGGGIFNSSSTVTMINSTISGNTTQQYGGGIFNNGTLNLNSVTVTQNRTTNAFCPDCAGGIFNNFLAANLNNTIVAGNSAVYASAPPDFHGAISSTSSYNLIGNGQGMSGIANGTNGNQVGTAINPIDPRLAPLADNGGLTLTHALLPGSPAINTGNNQFATATDQRGFARIVGGIIDIGAYEFQPTTPNPTPTPIPTPAPNCAFTLNPTAQSFAAGAGQSGSFAFTASSEDCVYSVFSNDSFISIINGGTGRGSGGVSYTIDANSGAARTGSIFVGGQTFTVNQAGAVVRRKKMLLSPVN